MTKKNFFAFRQNYEDNISKKLNIEEEEFYNEYYENKQPLGLTIFGFIMFFYGLFILLKIHTIYGILLTITSFFFIYGGITKIKLVFKISKNGIWSEEFGFIYFRHIERFEFYWKIMRSRRLMMKIYFKNYKLYNLENPYLEQSISYINNYKNLKQTLENAFTVENKHK